MEWGNEKLASRLTPESLSEVNKTCSAFPPPGEPASACPWSRDRSTCQNLTFREAALRAGTSVDRPQPTLPQARVPESPWAMLQSQAGAEGPGRLPPDRTPGSTLLPAGPFPCRPQLCWGPQASPCLRSCAGVAAPRGLLRTSRPSCCTLGLHATPAVLITGVRAAPQSSAAARIPETSYPSLLCVPITLQVPQPQAAPLPHEDQLC